MGLAPDAVVGVSMGSIVGVTWALRKDWYQALLGMDTHAFPRPFRPSLISQRLSTMSRLRAWQSLARAGWDLFAGWGIGTDSVPAGREVLEHLTLGLRLEDGRVPLAVSATDLRSGRRVVFRSGDAADAMYASSAVAGVLPPRPRGDWLLADGAYADVAPVDVGRSFGCPVVLAVDSDQELESHEPTTGYEVLLRAIEISQLAHDHLRFAEADLVLRPSFRRPIDTLDFGARRECVAAGLLAVRSRRQQLRRLLLPESRIDGG